MWCVSQKSFRDSVSDAGVRRRGHLPPNSRLPQACAVHTVHSDLHCFNGSTQKCSLNRRPFCFRGFRCIFWSPQTQPKWLLPDIFAYPHNIPQCFCCLHLAVTSWRRGRKDIKRRKEKGREEGGEMVRKGWTGSTLPEM